MLATASICPSDAMRGCAGELAISGTLLAMGSIPAQPTSRWIPGGVDRLEPDLLQHLARTVQMHHYRFPFFFFFFPPPVAAGAGLGVPGAGETAPDPAIGSSPSAAGVPAPADPECSNGTAGRRRAFAIVERSRWLRVSKRFRMIAEWVLYIRHWG